MHVVEPNQMPFLDQEQYTANRAIDKIIKFGMMAFICTVIMH